MATSEFTYSCTYENIEYDFVFVLEYTPITPFNQNFDDGEYPYISCSLGRSDKDLPIWAWEGELAPDPPINFELDYEDNINISGFINLFQSKDTGGYYVFLNTFYGIDQEEHFEGNIQQVANSNVPPVD
jgi:hypothetical protein